MSPSPENHLTVTWINGRLTPGRSKGAKNRFILKWATYSILHSQDAILTTTGQYEVNQGQWPRMTLDMPMGKAKVKCGYLLTRITQFLIPVKSNTFSCWKGDSAENLSIIVTLMTYKLRDLTWPGHFLAQAARRMPYTLCKFPKRSAGSFGVHFKKTVGLVATKFYVQRREGWLQLALRW